MTGSEQREAARQFINRWRGKGKEDEDGRSYWIELLSNVFGVENVTERIDFEKKVVVDGNTKRIDVYIPETRVIIEQKSLNVPLNKKIRNSGDIDLTPFEQADRYNSKLIFDERARWIVTCNFAEIWIYDMNEKQPEPTKIMLEELQTKYSLLDFLIEKEVQKISHEMEVSIKAGDIVGLLYNAFLKQYKIPEEKKNETAVEKEKREHKLKSLNALCVRLVFCLYAEDAGIFGEKHNMFHDYLARYEARDCRRALIELFKVLDTEEEDREDYLEEELVDFPYVNGGLFADESVEIPQFTEEIRELLLTKASEEFNWRDISPTIFGAVFESTLNPETRRSGGMHYTSIENIHKVIDPLFLDELQEEFETIQAYKTLNVKRKKLMDFQEKLAHLKFLDPACGSGNFLTETYLSLRRLENKVLRVLYGEGQGVLGVAASDIIKVSIQQFYGIEINDFAVTVAKTALWIAESQMLDETKNIIYGLDGDFLPLKTYVNITEGNALKIDWNSVVSANELSYIMGNPPFVGHKNVSIEQKEDMKRIFNNKQGRLDTQRWILFLKDAEPKELRTLPKVMERIQAVKDFRLSSKAKEIRKFAETPTLFAQQTQPVGEPFVIVPIVSSSRRRYIPMGYVDGDTIVNNRVFLIPNADLFMFGILNSNVHNAWMRKVAVRLKNDYSYSKDLVYNTFPIPELTVEHKKNISETAKSILDARAFYPNSSLADLYDPLLMPIELRKAHIANDKAVMAAYGFSLKMSEEDCVEELMKLYQKMMLEEKMKKSDKKSKKK